MFGFGKKWQNKVLIEGEKEAMALAQIEGFPDVNPDFDCYPVDVTLKEKKTFCNVCSDYGGFLHHIFVTEKKWSFH